MGGPGFGCMSPHNRSSISQVVTLRVVLSEGSRLGAVMFPITSTLTHRVSNVSCCVTSEMELDKGGTIPAGWVAESHLESLMVMFRMSSANAMAGHWIFVQWVPGMVSPDPVCKHQQKMASMGDNEGLSWLTSISTAANSKTTSNPPGCWNLTTVCRNKA